MDQLRQWGRSSGGPIVAGQGYRCKEPREEKEKHGRGERNGELISICFALTVNQQPRNIFSL